jgi:ElaB/YqjD/DUF883 family membrane-anchored ribosome-binding protein
MVSTTTAAHGIAKDARDAMKQSARAMSAGSEDIQADIDALRSDIADLAKQLAKIASTKGNSAFRHAKSGAEDTIADLEKWAHNKGDDVTEAITNSVQAKPYTTLAIAAGLGFLFGTSWRR